jgi:hypothetical protein
MKAFSSFSVMAASRSDSSFSGVRGDLFLDLRAEFHEAVVGRGQCERLRQRPLGAAVLLGLQEVPG